MADEPSKEVEALREWARRVLVEPADCREDQRRHPRRPHTEEVTLIPLCRPSLEPQLDRAVAGTVRDRSVGGFGIRANEPLSSDLVVAELAGGGIFLLRLVWSKEGDDQSQDCGFQILDQQQSTDELFCP